MCKISLRNERNSFLKIQFNAEKKKISATDYTYLELVKCESTLIPRASFVICKTRRSSRHCYTAGVIKSKTLGARNCPIIHPRQALSISLFASQFAQATFIACKLSSRSRLFNQTSSKMECIESILGIYDRTRVERRSRTICNDRRVQNGFRFIYHLALPARVQWIRDDLSLDKQGIVKSSVYKLRVVRI